MKLSKRKVDRAIRIIEFSQDSHEGALEHPETEVTGSPKFHKEAVREYEKVLEVLRKARGQL